MTRDQFLTSEQQQHVFIEACVSYTYSILCYSMLSANQGFTLINLNIFRMSIKELRFDLDKKSRLYHILHLGLDIWLYLCVSVSSFFVLILFKCGCG